MGGDVGGGRSPTGDIEGCYVILRQTTCVNPYQNSTEFDLAIETGNFPIRMRG